MLTLRPPTGFSRAILVCLSIEAMSACAWFRSTVNDSPGLRWWLFSNFGAQKVCPKVLTSGVPLRIDSSGPIIGRFFPNECQQRVDDSRQTMALTFAGTGFAWTPIAGRVGFRASATAEYRMDFRMESDALYVYAVPSGAPTAAPQFQLGAVENSVVNWAAQGPAGYLASTFGSQIITSHLAAGFTAIRSDSGDEFALGHLVPPQRPPKPYSLSSDDRISLVNETAEIHMGQIDIAGPLAVEDDGQALFFRARVEGPDIDAFVYARYAVDAWREGLQTGAALAPPPVAPVATYSFASGVETSLTLRVSKGNYVLVFDNSNKLGQKSPPFNLLGMIGSGAAKVSYAIEVGKAPN
jgi:hypothetical protein